MENLLSVSDSGADSTGDFNPYFITTQPVIVQDNSKWTDAEIARLIQVVVRPILLLVGTVGNCITFYIMRRTSLKDLSSCFYMSILALAYTSM